MYTKQDLENLSDEMFINLREESYNPDYWEDLEHSGMGVTKDEAWALYEEIGNPTYSDEHMWDPSNQFCSYGEYMEYLEHQFGTEGEFKRNEEFFQYHHLL